MLGFFLEGYGWLPNLRRRSPDGVVETRALGRRVTALCGPGETVTAALLRALLPMLAKLDYEVPEQDTRIPLHSVPTRPKSGMILANVRSYALRTA